MNGGASRDPDEYLFVSRYYFSRQYSHPTLSPLQQHKQTVDFRDECLHKHKDVCIEAINEKLAAYPELFDHRESFTYEVNKIREKTDEGYNFVSLRLNPDESTVGGLLGDGMVWYPYEWCLPDDDCYTIGPWGELDGL